MKKVWMVVLGIFAVLFASEADNVGAYYLIDGKRYANLMCKNPAYQFQYCFQVASLMNQSKALFIDKNNQPIIVDMDTVRRLYLSNPKDMEFYNSLKKDMKGVYDYKEE